MEIIKNNLTDKQWLEMFPQFVKEIPKRIKDLEREKRNLVLTVRKYLKSIDKNWTTNDKNFYLEQIKVFKVWDIVEIERQIYNLKRYLAISKGRAIKGRISDEVIQLALSAPIKEVAIKAGIKLRKSGRNFTASCPFHHDRSPSLYLYPERNDYHCFGCGAHGNVINFVQQLHKYSFKGAVEYLTF